MKSDRPPRRGLLFLGVAGSLIGVLAWVGGALGGSDEGVISRRAAATRYSERIQPILDRGGSVVAHGLRPGITDIRHGRFADSVLQSMTDNWRSQLESVRADLAAVPRPGLEPAYADFDLALQGYLDAARFLQDAAREHGAEREAAIQAAVRAGEQADALFDKARARLGKLAESL